MEAVQAWLVNWGSSHPEAETVSLILLLSFCLGNVVGWVYMWTHSGLSYSRMFVSSLVVLPVVVALVMTLLSTNIAIAFGFLAVFSVVRFRNVIKDPRDTTFVLWSVVLGMAAGISKYGIALVGGGFVGLVFLYLHLSQFGRRLTYDTILNLTWLGASPEFDPSLRAVIRRHASRHRLQTGRQDPGAGLHLSFHLLLRDPSRAPELLADLETLDAAQQLSLFTRDEETEA